MITYIALAILLALIVYANQIIDALTKVFMKMALSSDANMKRIANSRITLVS